MAVNVQIEQHLSKPRLMRSLHHSQNDIDQSETTANSPLILPVLPEELIDEILIRLPVISLLRF
ncbi:hypothetical protein A2U01_0075001, partial [Trifolium medium]|nr:hypothetical protein [Trifolium medium]